MEILFLAVYFISASTITSYKVAMLFLEAFVGYLHVPLNFVAVDLASF